MGYLYCARLFMSTGGGELAQFLVFYTLLSHRLLLFRYRVPMYRIMAFSYEYQNGVAGQFPLPPRILRQGSRAYCTLILSVKRPVLNQRANGASEARRASIWIGSRANGGQQKLPQ